MDENTKLEIIKNFKSRNIEVAFFETLEDIKDKINELIHIDCTVAGKG